MSSRISPPPSLTIPSTHENSRGSFVYDVTDYGNNRSLGAGIFLPSKTFQIGGFDWTIRLYPGGHVFEKYSSPDYVAVTLELMTKDAVVIASYDMGFVDQVTGARYFPIENSTAEFDSNRAKGQSRWFMSRFMKRTDLEASPLLHDDRIVLECSLAIIKGSQLSNDEQGDPGNTLPPSDMADHWCKMLRSEEGADVTFVVERETIRAHRIVLAARSPVFKQQLDLRNPMPPNVVIAVSNMTPEVFKSLLHFIYTDNLPDMDDLDDNSRKERIGFLLFAAQTYGLDRLKVICEDILSKSLEVDTVCNVLLRVHQCNCNRLKDACIDFINSDSSSEVERTEGYKHLKTNCLALLIEVLERR